MATRTTPEGQTESADFSSSGPQRPAEALQSTQSMSSAVPTAQVDGAAPRKRRNHRAGKKKRTRRQSFAAPSDNLGDVEGSRSGEMLEAPQTGNGRPPFFRLGQSGGRNLSQTSLDSQALLDHRYGSIERQEARVSMLMDLRSLGTIHPCELVATVASVRMPTVHDKVNLAKM